jgi:hypothetical protein
MVLPAKMERDEIARKNNNNKEKYINKAIKIGKSNRIKKIKLNKISRNKIEKNPNSKKFKSQINNN